MSANITLLGHSTMSRGTVLELWHEEEEKCKPIFDKYTALAAEKGVGVIVVKKKQNSVCWLVFCSMRTINQPTAC